MSVSIFRSDTVSIQIRCAVKVSAAEHKLAQSLFLSLTSVRLSLLPNAVRSGHMETETRTEFSILNGGIESVTFIGNGTTSVCRQGDNQFKYSKMSKQTFRQTVQLVYSVFTVH